MANSKFSFIASLACGIALLTGCPGDDTGSDEGSNDSTSTGGDDMVTTVPMTTAGMTMTGDDDDDDMMDTTAGDDDDDDDDDDDADDDDDDDDDDMTTTGTTGDTDTEGTTTGDPTTGSTTDEPTTTGMMAVEGYNDCYNNAEDDVCTPEQICIIDADPASIGVCSSQNCVDETDCPDAPATGDAPVVCASITGDMVTDCYLDCQMGETCPDGMSCFADFLCAFVEPPPPLPMDPYGDCSTDLLGGCDSGEACLNGNTPAGDGIAVCGYTFCSDDMDCPAAPATGDATVTCADFGGPVCVLDCSAGETCPDGMACDPDVLVCVFEQPIPAAQDGGSCCVGDSGVPGCDVAEIEGCVCGSIVGDTFCCTDEWDAACVGEAEDPCNATCM